VGRKYWAEVLLSEFSPKFSLAENSAQFPELDAFLAAKCFSWHEMQVHTSINGMQTSALEAAPAMSFPTCPTIQPKIRSLEPICPNIHPIYHFL
jgi:hypothetical protein